MNHRLLVLVESVTCYVLAVCVVYAVAWAFMPAPHPFNDYADTDEYHQRMERFRERVEARGLDPDNL